MQGLTNATEVAAGERHTCALLAGGSIECWGENKDGELGDGTTDSSDTPVEVLGITTASEVATSLLHTCALLANGHVECWGDIDDVGRHVELEEPDKFYMKKPVEVEGIASAVQLAAGLEYTCAVASDGRIECWGGNELMGQLAAFNGRRRRLRELRREQLTQPERILVWAVFWATAIGPSLLIVAGVLLLLRDGPHALGIALLLLGLVVTAVPTGPLLRAWGHRRATRRSG